MLNFMKKALASIGLTQHNREITDPEKYQNSFNPLRLSNSTGGRGYKLFGMALSAAMLGFSIYYGIGAGIAVFGLFLVSDVLDLAYSYRDENQLGVDSQISLQQAA